MLLKLHVLVATEYMYMYILAFKYCDYDNAFLFIVACSKLILLLLLYYYESIQADTSIIVLGHWLNYTYSLSITQR